MHGDGAILNVCLVCVWLAKCLEIFSDGWTSKLTSGYLDLEDLDMVRVISMIISSDFVLNVMIGSSNDKLGHLTFLTSVFILA